MGMSHTLPISASNPKGLIGWTVAWRSWSAEPTEGGLQHRTGTWDYGSVFDFVSSECYVQDVGTNREKARACWQVRMDAAHPACPPRYLKWPLPRKERGSWVFKSGPCHPQNLITHSALCCGMIPQMDAVDLVDYRIVDRVSSYVPPAEILQTMDQDMDVYKVAHAGYSFNGRCLGWHASSNMEHYSPESILPAFWGTATTNCQPYSSLRKRDYGMGLDANTEEGEDNRKAIRLVEQVWASGKYEATLLESTKYWRDGDVHTSLLSTCCGPNGMYFSATANINLLDLGCLVGPKEQTIVLMSKKKYAPPSFRSHLGGAGPLLICCAFIGISISMLSFTASLASRHWRTFSGLAAFSTKRRSPGITSSR